MSGEYNSILKEKKVYTDPVVENKHPMFKRAIKIGIFISLIIIVISYVIYFNTVLTGESIYLNNITKLLDKYSSIYDNFRFNYDISNNYSFEGTVVIDSRQYDYMFIKDGNKLKRNLKNNDNSISYYYDGSLVYMKLFSLGDSYVQMNNQLYDIDYYDKRIDILSNQFDVYVNDIFLDSRVSELSNRLYNLDNYSDILERIKSNYNNISSDKYIKKVYIEDKKPIVEIDLVLSTGDINNILGDEIENLHVSDDVEVSIIMKNHAITNEICSIKIVINNKSENKRSVVNYQDNRVIITDDSGKNNKLEFSQNGSDLTLKYYKDDLLYSVLTGKVEDTRYVYKYQVIDEIYNIQLSVDNSDNNYNYLLEMNLNNEISNVSISGNYYNIGEIVDDVSEVVKYDDLEVSLKNQFDFSIGKLLFGY